MKAVILEIKDGYASVLSDDGCFVKIKNNDYEIGQVIQMSNPKISITRKITAFAASAAAVLVLGVGTWAYASPYSYVSLDVNPSIEFIVNRFDRVLRVKAVNDDGEEIIQEIKLDDLENKSIEDAITKTVEEISEAGYFAGPVEGGIVIATSGKDEEKAEELAQELQQTVETKVDELAVVNENDEIITVEAFSVGLERVEEARELGVTPGKLNLVEKLQASATDPESILLEDWLNKPVKDIMKATKEYRKASAVTGSAIVIMNKDDEKAEKAQEALKKAEEKAFEAQKKAEEKAFEAQKKAEEKAFEAQKKAEEKAFEAQKKAVEEAAKQADKSAKEARKSAEEAAKIKDKEAEKYIKASEKAAEKAKEAAEKAAEEAKKANELKEKEAKKATEEAKKAAKEAEKAAEEAKKAAKDAADEVKKTSEKNDKKNAESSELIIDAQSSNNSNKGNSQSNNGSGKGPKGN